MSALECGMDIRPAMAPALGTRSMGPRKTTSVVLALRTSTELAVSAHFVPCLDGVRFIGCDMREARFGTTMTGCPIGTMHGTSFEDCDLRGTFWDKRHLSDVRFVRCIFEGARGRPGSMEHVHVEDCDLDYERLVELLR